MSISSSHSDITSRIFLVVKQTGSLPVINMLVKSGHESVRPLTTSISFLRFFYTLGIPRRIMIRIARSIDDRMHQFDHLSSVMRFKRRVYNAFYRTRFSRGAVALQLIILGCSTVALHQLLHGVRHPFQKSILSFLYFDCFNPRRSSGISVSGLRSSEAILTEKLQSAQTNWIVEVDSVGSMF